MAIQGWIWQDATRPWTVGNNWNCGQDAINIASTATSHEHVARLYRPNGEQWVILTHYLIEHDSIHVVERPWRRPLPKSIQPTTCFILTTPQVSKHLWHNLTRFTRNNKEFQRSPMHSGKQLYELITVHTGAEENYKDPRRTWDPYMFLSTLKLTLTRSWLSSRRSCTALPFSVYLNWLDQQLLWLCRLAWLHRKWLQSPKHRTVLTTKQTCWRYWINPMIAVYRVPSGWNPEGYDIITSM